MLGLRLSCWVFGLFLLCWSPRSLMAQNATNMTSNMTMRGACDICKKNAGDCADLHYYYLAGSIVTMIGALFVICTYVTIERLRKHPSSLIFSRCIFDFLWGVYFFIIFFFDVKSLACNRALCSGLGAFAYLTFSGSQAYFAAISIDLYLSIRNPFGKPDSHLKLMHYSILSFIVIFTLILYWSDNFAWREDMQICFIRADSVNNRSVNAVTALTIYVPAGVIIVASIVNAVFAGRRLKAGLPDTFKLRMRILKDGFFYCACFSVYFLFVGISYFLIWLNSGGTRHNNNGDIDHSQDWIYYVFAAIFGSLGLVDLVIWYYSKFSHNNVLNRKQKHQSMDESTFYTTTDRDRGSLSQDDIGVISTGSTLTVPGKKKAMKPATSPIPLKPQKKTTGITISMKQHRSDEGTINKALRREVLAYTTDGIAQSLDRAQEIAKHTYADNNSLPRASDYPTALNGINSTAIQSFTMHIRYNEELLYGRKSNAAPQDADNDDKNDGTGPTNGAKQGRQHLLEQTRNQQSSIGVGIPGLGGLGSTSQPLKKEKSSMFHPKKKSQLRREREFVDYAPLAFRFIRQRVLGMSDEEYVRSVIPSTKEAQKDVLDAKYGEGKSGAFFYFTHDSKFLVKTITKAETQFFISILREYTEYLNDNPDVVANRFLGLHSCQMYGLRFYFVVMQNIFLANLQPHEKYDLKGSWVDRSTNHGIGSGKIMKDLDLKKYIVLGKRNKERLLDQMEKDTRFLMKLNIMDYSLLLGVFYMKIAHQPPEGVYPRGRGLSYDVKDRLDEERRSSEKALLTSYAGGVRAQVIEGPGIYYMGIIDILQNYTFQKKCEHYLKRYVLRKDGLGISCVDPVTYQKRFMDYMRKIIVEDRQYYMEEAINVDQFTSQTLFVYPGDDQVETNMRQLRMSFIGSHKHGASGAGSMDSNNKSSLLVDSGGGGLALIGPDEVKEIQKDSPGEDGEDEDNDEGDDNDDGDADEDDNKSYKQQSETPTPVANTLIEMENVVAKSNDKTASEAKASTKGKASATSGGTAAASGSGSNRNSVGGSAGLKKKQASNSSDKGGNTKKNSLGKKVSSKASHGNMSLQTGFRNSDGGSGRSGRRKVASGGTNQTIKFTTTPSVKDLSVKLSPRSGRSGVEIQTPVESNSRTGPPTRAASHSVTGTGVTISGTEASDEEHKSRTMSPQPASTQVEHNNRILVTRHNDEPTPEMLDDGHQYHAKNALSVSPAATMDDMSENQSHEPIEPSVTDTAGVFSHSYGDTAARRSDIGIISTYTDRTNDVRQAQGLITATNTDVEKSEAQGGPIQAGGHKTMLSGSIIPPQEARVSEFYASGRDGRGMSVITDDGRVSVTDFGTDLPLATDDDGTLRSRSDNFDETKDNHIKQTESMGPATVLSSGNANASVSQMSGGTNINRNLSSNSLTHPSVVSKMNSVTADNRHEKNNTVTINESENLVTNNMPTTLKFAHSVSASLTESNTDLKAKTGNNTGNSKSGPGHKHVD